MPHAASLLEARGVVKRFPGVVALKDVSFDLHAGEIHALCGENGAGKSTLINVLSGIHPAGSYEGQILLDGQLLQLRHIADAEAAGLAVIHQELAVVPELSVAENIFLGREPTHHGLIDWPSVQDQARRLLARFAVPIAPEARVKDLGVGHQQLVEIVKALSKQSRILILDEPTAALPEHEVQVLLDILRGLRHAGVSCIYISHRLDEVFDLADRVTVLRDGQSVATLDAAKTGKAEVIRHMVGREITDLFPRRQARVGAPRLKASRLTVRADDGRLALRDIELEVREGEVVGLGGLMGAGRTELLMHLFGAWGRRVRGQVELNGRPLDHPTPQRAIRAGLALVTEDRRRYGLVLDQSVSFNLTLSSLRELCRAGLIDRSREVQESRRLVDSLRIKTASLETPAGKLSGGNQQKVVLGKAMLTKPSVVFLDEPTRGIDVGAKVEIYELVNRLTEAGQAVVLVSSELSELMAMSDRIVMLHEGAIGGTFRRDEATQEKLMAAAMGQELN